MLDRARGGAIRGNRVEQPTESRQQRRRHRPLLESKSIWQQRVAVFAKGWEAVLPALKRFIEED